MAAFQDLSQDPKASDTLRFEVEGLNCASCVGRAEKALGGLEAVGSVTINLANKMAEVEGEALSAADLAAALDDAGYPAARRSASLEIEDMTCASCVARVEQALASAPGVVSAAVNLATSRAQIEVLAGSSQQEEASIAAAAKASSDAGYPAYRLGRTVSQSLDGSRLRFAVEGLSCASCVGRAEKALSGVEAVSEASINLATKTAEVQGQALKAADLAAALDEAGYPAARRSASLEIEGMTCASCVARVEQALASAPGVVSAAVNLASSQAEIEVLAGSQQQEEASIAAAERASTAIGYPAHWRRPAGEGEAAARPSLAERQSSDQAAAWRKFLIAAVMTAPVFILEMAGHAIPAFHMWVHATIGQTASWLLQFLLTSLVLVWPGRQFFQKGLPALAKRRPDMDALVALGAGAAWLYSSVATFAPSLLPADSRAVYFEAAAVIVTLILLGRFLEARAKGKAGAAIQKLLDLQAKTAWVQQGNGFVERPIEAVVVGDRLQLRPGETVAVDGRVVRGHSNLDESMISGEPLPVAKSEGDTVVAGTINGQGSLVYEAEGVGSDTMLARIIRMVEQAQGSKLPVQDLVNRISSYFVPAVMLIAAATLLIWLLAGAPLNQALVAAVSVLIIACPCAMGLATPTSIMVGTGRAAELGVLFRKGAALQSLNQAEMVAFDKTGTLTQGRPELTHFEPQPGFDEQRLLAQVAAVEAASEHAIAEALVRAAQDRKLDLPEREAFQAIAGFGVDASVGGQRLLIGAARLMQRDGLALGDLESRADKLAHQGVTPLFVAVDGKLAALIGVSDPIKPSSAAAIAALKAAGRKVAMITGDAQGTAEAIAARLGIDSLRAEVLPDGKVAAIEELRAQHGKLAFVGDGINDAPALASADCGLAMGSGTDVAIESADVVLISGDLSAVTRAFDLSRATMANIRQNLVWAFGYNLVLIPVAAGLLYPSLGWQLSPALAAGAMAASSVMVVTNALRLRWVGRRPADGPENQAVLQGAASEGPAPRAPHGA